MGNNRSRHRRHELRRTMKTSASRLMALILVCIAAKLGWAQSLPPGLPTVNGATADASVTLDANSGVFTYSYVVTNSTASVGALQDFVVDITTTIGGVPLDSSGLINSATGYEQNISQLNARALGAAIIPVGLASQPPEWSVTLDAYGRASWFAASLTPVDISSGQSFGGFVMQSRGIPGIRSFAVSAFCEPGVNSPGIDEVATDTEALQITNQENMAALACLFRGMTIGPVSPPSLTDPSVLIDFLISQKHQSASLGWLRNDDFVKDLDEEIDQAKKAIVKGHGFLARRKVEGFIKKLKDQKKKQLYERHDRDERDNRRDEKDRDLRKSESFINNNAYFLLKADAEFIISKLPSKPTDRDDDGRGNNR